MGLLYPTMGPSETERYIYLMAEAARKESEYRKVLDYRDFYSGDHPSMLTERQEEFLGPLLTETEHTVAHNLCRTVIDVLRERLRVDGFSGDDAAGEALVSLVGEWWDAAHMDEQQITVHRRALRDGKTYLILEWDQENQRPSWIPNRRYDGKEGVTFYRDANSDKPLIAFKYWTEYNPLQTPYEVKRRTAYLPGEIRRYRESNVVGGWEMVEQPQIWTNNMQVGGKPLGLACIEFRNPGGESEIESIIGLQMALNKTWLDAIATADASGFPILALQYPGPMPQAPADDEETTSDDLKIAPGRALELSDGATLNRIPASDVAGLLDLIDRIAGAIAGVSRTPQYYLRPFGGSEVPSGEALKQLESALVARAEERSLLFGGAWESAVKLAAGLYRAMGYNGADPEAKIAVMWASHEVRNDAIEAATALQEKQLGLPDEYLWSSRLGMSEDDIDKAKKMRAREQAASLANVLMSVQNQGQQNAQQNQPGQPQNVAQGNGNGNVNGNGQQPGAANV